MDRRLGSSSKYKGLSKAVLLHGFRRPQRQVATLTAGKQATRMATQSQKRRNMIQGLSQEDREAVQRMDLDADYASDDVDAVSYTAPPGEEGFDISHEGGEFEVFEDLATGPAESGGY